MRLFLFLLTLVVLSSCSMIININKSYNTHNEVLIFNGTIEFLDGKYQGQEAFVSLYNVPNYFFTAKQPIRIKSSDFVTYKGKFN
jgi:hypothetical protein